jgi:hypothetical protein
MAQEGHTKARAKRAKWGLRGGRPRKTRKADVCWMSPTVRKMVIPRSHEKWAALKTPKYSSDVGGKKIPMQFSKIGNKPLSQCCCSIKRSEEIALSK